MCNGPVDTIVSIRRIHLVVGVAIAAAGVAWATWPAATWPRAFCAPVVRVIGADARAIVTYQAQNENTPITPAEHKLVATLRADIVLAEAVAPTAQLRSEIRNHVVQLHGAYASMSVVSDVMSQFEQHARTQLRACGVTPVGR